MGSEDQMHAVVVVRYKINHVCNRGDPEACEQSFSEMVQDMIGSEGLMGLVEDEGQILSIEELKETNQ